MLAEDDDLVARIEARGDDDEADGVGAQDHRPAPGDGSSRTPLHHVHAGASLVGHHGAPRQGEDVGVPIPGDAKLGQHHRLEVAIGVGRFDLDREGAAEGLDRRSDERHLAPSRRQVGARKAHLHGHALLQIRHVALGYAGDYPHLFDGDQTDDRVTHAGALAQLEKLLLDGAGERGANDGVVELHVRIGKRGLRLAYARLRLFELQPRLFELAGADDLAILQRQQPVVVVACESLLGLCRLDLRLRLLYRRPGEGLIEPRDDAALLDPVSGIGDVLDPSRGLCREGCVVEGLDGAGYLDVLVEGAGLNDDRLHPGGAGERPRVGAGGGRLAAGARRRHPEKRGEEGARVAKISFVKPDHLIRFRRSPTAGRWKFISRSGRETSQPWSGALSRVLQL